LREFTANIITELRSLWQELVIVHGRPRHPQSQGTVEGANADIKEMIISWMNDNDTTQWSEGLRVVQFQKNRSHHRVIDQPPYKALFGADPNIGLVLYPRNYFLSERLKKTIDDVDIVGEWTTTWAGRPFLGHIDNEWGVCVFSTDKNYHRLLRCDTVFIDGTFN
jgi:hypothetical protein